GPHNVLGLEVNEFAAELARVTVWIGDIQWCRRNKYEPAMNPILRPLEGIAHQDALLNADGSEAEWPPADVIVGNPPFLGDKKMLRALGENYVNTLRSIYQGRVPGGADLVTYWFEKARDHIESGKAQAAGLVATNSIRGGANRKVLERICNTGTIFNAWSDEQWINEGAAVRVSLVAFRHHGEPIATMLNGQPVLRIQSNLSGANNQDKFADITKAYVLAKNANTCFIGTQKTGAFDVSGSKARNWLKEPNPHGKPNSDVVRPWVNGKDLTNRASDTWIIDFGISTLEKDACLYEHPFSYLIEHVQNSRSEKRETVAAKWWLHTRPRPDMRKALQGLNRYIVTPRVAKHRFFVWLPIAMLPDSRLCVISRADDVTFGLLSAKFHTCWSLATCSWHGVGNDPTYNAQSCFETFPFPAGLTPADTKHGTETLDSGAIIPIVADELKERARAIANAAHQLNTLRNNWLNPKEWVDWVITPEEQQAGFPSRPIAKPGHETALKQRTLTNLYNKPPAWLINAHRALDIAVAQAYGWEDYTHELPDDMILQRLLALNLARNA
ncbi:hypothetical protein SAMN05421644_1783, partial [Allochromatium warmingii]